MATKIWPAVVIDVMKVLRGKSKRLDNIELPDTLTLQVILELDEELYKTLKANPSWLQKLQTKAMDEADDAIRKAARMLEDADKQAEKENDKRAAADAGKALENKLEDLFEAAGKDISKVAAKLVEDYIKADKELSRFKVKAWAKIAITAVTVTAGALASVASSGALSPVTSVGIVRGGMTIVKELDKLASDTDSTSAAIRKQLDMLRSDFQEVESKWDKAVNGAREVRANLWSKLLNVNLPSVKNCSANIALHGKNITVIERQSKKLSESIYAAMDAQLGWQKEFDRAKATLPAPAVGKVKVQLEKAEKALDTLLKKVTALNESIVDADKQHASFEKALAAIEDGLPGWVKYVDSAASLVVDLGTGINDASDALSRSLAVVTALVQTAADEKLTAKA